MMKKKDIQAMLDNHIQIGNELSKTIKETIYQDIDFEDKQKQIDYLASKEELNDFAISLLKRILE